MHRGLYGTEMKSAHLLFRRLVLPEEDSRIQIDRDIPLMYVEDRDSLERLHEAAKQCRKARTWPRVQAVVLAKQGDTASDIARALGVSRRAVQAWVAAYNRGGLEALPDRPHPGRAPILPRAEEGRFGQQGTLTRVWARRGSRPRRVRQNGRTSLYVLTAVCAASGAAAGLIAPELNTAVVNLFLEQFARQLAPGVHAVLLWDGAGYHVGKDLVVPANVSLINLLPYSPELNPVENLWHYLRAHYWSHGVYPDYEALLEVATETWRTVCMDPEKVRSICAAPYLERRNSFF